LFSSFLHTHCPSQHWIAPFLASIPFFVPSIICHFLCFLRALFFNNFFLTHAVPNLPYAS
jgi:hypothetical protein